MEQFHEIPPEEEQIIQEQEAPIKIPGNLNEEERQALRDALDDFRERNQLE